MVEASIQDLRPNPQDRSAFYLQNIYQLLADPDTPNVSIPAAPTIPPRFSPPRHAVWVNSLWFLSLTLSLTCGLLATLLGQWARQYLKVIQTRSSPHKRARIRSFFAEGIDKSHCSWAVVALPFLFHLSLSLFFSGLLVLLFNTNHAVFGVVAGWVGLCVAGYGYITVIPIFRQDRPYLSPLSSPAWSLLNGTIYAAIRALYFSGILDRISFAIRDHMINLGAVSKRRFVDGIVKTAQKTALKVSHEIDSRAIMWTFDSLDEDQQLERFFASLPGFCSSKVVSNPSGVFIEPYKWRLSDALVGLMHRTLTSDLVNESVRKRRSLICTRAMHAAALSIRPHICEEIINGGWDGLLNHVEFGQFIKWNRYTDPSVAYSSACIVGVVIAKAKERGDLWRELVIGQLGISAHVLQDYLAYGDSALLANYIHILRDIIHVHLDQFRSGDPASRWKFLELVSQFDVQNTLPTLQHDFCDLWNEIVDMTRTTPDYQIRSILIILLKNVRRAYIALHDGTDSAPTAFSGSTADDEHALFMPSSYPLCNLSSHRLRTATHVHDVLVDMTAHSYPSGPQTTILPGASSGYSAEIRDRGLPPVLTSAWEPAPASPAQGATNASITTSSSSLVPFAQSTQPATTTFTSLSHVSPSFGTPASAIYTKV